MGSSSRRGRAPRLAISLVVLVGLSVVVTSGVGNADGRSSAIVGANGPPPDVVLIGESLLRQVAPLEVHLLDEADVHAAIEARDSQSLSSPFVQTDVRQAVEMGTPIVVLETSSNDAFLGAGTAPPSAWPAALAHYRATLTATLAELAHQCTVLVDTRVTDTSKWYALDRIGPAINQSIAAAARTHPGSVEAVAWSTASAAHGPDWFWKDGLHFGDPAQGNADWHAAGANAFAEAIAAGVRACRADLHRRAPRTS